MGQEMAGVCKRLIIISIGWQDDEFLFADNNINGS